MDAKKIPLVPISISKRDVQRHRRIDKMLEKLVADEFDFQALQ